MSGLLDLLRAYLNELGLQGACVDEGIAQTKKTFFEQVAKGNLPSGGVIAFNKGVFKALYCMSSAANCPGQDYVAQFGCGVANALIEEVDVVAMAEGVVSLAELIVTNAWECMLEGGVLGSLLQAQNSEQALRAMMKCGIGVDASPQQLGQLADSVASYVASHYADGYTHGKATVFVLTIGLPFGKVAKAAKVRALHHLEKLGGQADELSKLRKGVEAEDITEIRAAIGAAARGTLDGMTARTRQVLDEWPSGSYDKFQREVLETNLWDDIFKQADNQEGLVEAWGKLDDLGFSQAARRNIDNLKQRSIIDQYADDIANASNARKGNFGEIGADLDLNSKGYESLLSKRIDDIDAPGHNGIDGVYRKNGEYFIVEGKYTGSASLNSADEATGLARQMSDDWIFSDNRLVNAVGDELARDIELVGYKRVLAKVAPDGSVAYRLIDENGYVIRGTAGDFTP